MMNNGTYGRGSTLNTIFFSDQKEYGCRYCKHCDIESLKCYPESRDCESEYDLTEEDLDKLEICDFYEPLEEGDNNGTR